MNYSCNGHIPGGVSGHAKTKKRPNSVVVERRNEHRGCAACSKYICPCPFVQMVVYVVYITNIFTQKQNNSQFFFLYYNFIYLRSKTNLAQAMSCMTEPNRRKVQLKASPIAFQ